MEQSLFMTGKGAEEIWQGIWKNCSNQRGVLKKFWILERGSEIFCPSKPEKSRDSTLIRFHPIVPLFES